MSYASSYEVVLRYAAAEDYDARFIGDREDAAHAVNNLFGSGVHLHDIARASGALPGSEVRLSSSPTRDFLIADVDHPHLKTIRVFRRQKVNGRDALVVEHAFQSAHPDIRGNGYRRFAETLPHLRKLGVEHILTHAEGERGHRLNGYYTWPRLGFNGPIPRETLPSLPTDIRDKLKEAGTYDFHTLFGLPGGPEAWKTHGGPAYLHFDLAEGSPHSRNLDEYVRDRESRPPGSIRGPVEEGVRGNGDGGGDSGMEAAENPTRLDDRIRRALWGVRKLRREAVDDYAAAYEGGIRRVKYNLYRPTPTQRRDDRDRFHSNLDVLASRIREGNEAEKARYRDMIADDLEHEGDPLSVIFRHHRPLPDATPDILGELPLTFGTHPSRWLTTTLYPHKENGVDLPYPRVTLWNLGIDSEPLASAPVNRDELHSIIDHYGVDGIGDREKLESRIRAIANAHGENAEDHR